MAIVPYPDPHHHTDIGLRPAVAAQVSRSELTHARQAVDLGYSWWEASIAVANMRQEDARGWQVFFGRVRGPVHSFRVPITTDPQHAGAFVVRANGAGSGYQLQTDGWPASSTVLLAGQFVTVGDQLMRLDQNVATNAAGAALLRFHAPLRRIVADDTAIETRDPWLLASMPEGAPMLSVGLARIQSGFSFDVVEAY
ncbi:MAG: hypothetical protein CMI67_25905 [Pelagibaca sp.]|nr:hypothetical protein [Pelagibaca sp.]